MSGEAVEWGDLVDHEILTAAMTDLFERLESETTWVDFHDGGDNGNHALEVKGTTDDDLIVHLVWRSKWVRGRRVTMDDGSPGVEMRCRWSLSECGTAMITSWDEDYEPVHGMLSYWSRPAVAARALLLRSDPVEREALLAEMGRIDSPTANDLATSDGDADRAMSGRATEKDAR